jgi:ClpP class serine protease
LIFVVLSALQPVLWQRMQAAMRTRKISEIERKRGSRVILLVHRQETMRFLGFPLVRYIDMQDSEEIQRAVHMTEDGVPLDIVLHTPGGLVLAAAQIARAISDRKGKVSVFVPHYAMSGGTGISLAADEIIMSSHAALGPIDPQLDKYPAASLIKAVEQKPIAEVDDETLILADVGRKAIAQVKEAARGLLAEHMPAEQAEAIADKLTIGTWTHDYPIMAAEAKALYAAEVKKLYDRNGWQRPGAIDYVPHDARVTEWGSDKSRLEQMIETGFRPQIARELSLEDGINAVRAVLPVCEFDANAAADGIETLKAYRKDWDEDRGAWSDKPRHDFSSHGADGFRTGVATPDRELLRPKEPQPFKMKTRWPTFKELMDEHGRRTKMKGRRLTSDLLVGRQPGSSLRPEQPQPPTPRALKDAVYPAGSRCG